MSAGPRFQKNLAFEPALMAILQDVIGDMGKRSKLRLQEALSVLFPPASKPGESPHLRTGNLREGISSTVTTENGAVKMRVNSDRAKTPVVPYVLEFKMDRFYMKPEVLRLRMEGPFEFAKMMNARLK